MNYKPSDEDVDTAGKVLRAIKQVDPYYVNANLDTARAWALILGPTDYGEEELLAGVLDFYRHETKGRRCMPANVIEGAQRARERFATSAEGKQALERHREQRRKALDERIREGARLKELTYGQPKKDLPPQLAHRIKQRKDNREGKRCSM